MNKTESIYITVYMKEKYRFSSYSIVVPLNSEIENVFMMHGYTGAIDVLSKEIAGYLQSHDNFTKEDVPCSQTTIDVLEKRGYITKWSKEEEIEYAKRLANALYRKENILNNNFTVVVTYDCNFRCPYCFEKNIKKDTTTFTEEMTDRLYKAILEIAPEQKLRNNTITLYGGEPLLKENKESVTYLVETGKKLGFKFSAITNGYDLDYYEDLLGPDCICHIQITIDGMPELHNQKRIHRCGLQTFDKIVQNVGLALEKEVSVSIRVNTDRNNIQQLNELYQLFSEKGYTDNKLFYMYSALLRHHDVGAAPQNILSQKEYIQQIKESNIRCSHHDYGLSNRISTAIKRNSPLSLTASFSGAQNKGFVLDPLGRIYPCWEVVNQEEHLLGSYDGECITWNNHVQHTWRNSIAVKSECIRCKYVFLCRGGCPAHQLYKKQCTHIEEIVHHTVDRTYVSIK